MPGAYPTSYVCETCHKHFDSETSPESPYPIHNGLQFDNPRSKLWHPWCVPTAAEMDPESQWPFARWSLNHLKGENIKHRQRADALMREVLSLMKRAGCSDQDIADLKDEYTIYD